MVFRDWSTVMDGTGFIFCLHVLFPEMQGWVGTTWSCKEVQKDFAKDQKVLLCPLTKPPRRNKHMPCKNMACTKYEILLLVATYTF